MEGLGAEGPSVHTLDNRTPSSNVSTRTVRDVASVRGKDTMVFPVNQTIGCECSPAQPPATSVDFGRGRGLDSPLKFAASCVRLVASTSRFSCISMTPANSSTVSTRLANCTVGKSSSTQAAASKR